VIFRVSIQQLAIDRDFIDRLVDAALESGEMITAETKPVPSAA
jgi:hypothetical protein